jgi:hypothetical protein
MKKIFYIFLILFFSSSIFAKASFFVELTPSLLLNTEDKKYSAPSPVFFPLSLGVQIETPFAKIEPSISLWTNYYLLAHDKALISEIENRTSLAISSMINIPASFSIGETGLSISAGFAFFLRFALPLEGIEASDEVSKINEYFWQKMRFLYLSTDVQWMFDLPKVKAGPILRFYLPLGGLISDKSMNASIFNLGLKVCF